MGSEGLLLQPDAYRFQRLAPLYTSSSIEGRKQAYFYSTFFYLKKKKKLTFKDLPLRTVHDLGANTTGIVGIQGMKLTHGSLAKIQEQAPKDSSF